MIFDKLLLDSNQTQSKVFEFTDATTESLLNIGLMRCERENLCAINENAKLFTVGYYGTLCDLL